MKPRDMTERVSKITVLKRSTQLLSADHLHRIDHTNIFYFKQIFKSN